MNLKPWREVAVPHEDVLKGTFQQAEFAADLSRVHEGTATPEYQNPTLFFQRTFITEGMRLLLDSVVKRCLARVAIRSFNCRPLSAAARRTRCWPSITSPRVMSGQRFARRSGHS
jgi:hypothetical protein